MTSKEENPKEAQQEGVQGEAEGDGRETEMTSFLVKEEEAGSAKVSPKKDQRPEQQTCTPLMTSKIDIGTETLDADVDAGGGGSRESKSRRSSYHTSRRCYCGLSIGPFVRQITMSVVACLAALSIGMIHAYPAVALARWEEAGLNLTTSQTTWFASTPMVVSVVLCVGAGVVVESLGVRRCLILCLPFLALSWIVIALAKVFWMLLLGRVFQGIIASVYMVVITVYPVEVSIVRWRGIMMGVTEAMVMLGAFLTYLGGLVFLPSSMAYTMAAILVPQLICFFFLWESPLWLARKDRDQAAAASLRFLRGPGSDISAELEQIKANVYTERIQKPSPSEQLLLLRKIVYLKPMVLCVLVLLFKELTGQYAALAYTVQLFKMAGSSLDPYWCAVVMGAFRFLPCFMSWALIERIPRRLLLSSCMTIASFSLAALGAFIWFWSVSDEELPSHLGWIPLVCLSIYTLAFGCGVGPTSWTLVAELLPSQVRNVGSGVLNTCFSLFLFLVGLTFPFAAEVIGVGSVFLVYSACSLVGVIFVVTCLPETRGRSFHEIQTALDKRKSSNVV